MATEKKVLGLMAIILMTISANFGTLWIIVAASIGPSSISLWGTVNLIKLAEKQQIF